MVRYFISHILRWFIAGNINFFVNAARQIQDEHGGNIVIEAPRALLNVGGPARFEAERISYGSLRLALRETEGAPDGFRVYLERHGLGRKQLYPPVFITIENIASLAAKGNAISLPLQAMNVIVPDPEVLVTGLLGFDKTFGQSRH
ncbi:MAG: hypothetical protein IH905_11325 [Proteobacteria bacterium]|nr:hypothetical protein [Pseudomonadota bacterium]